MPEPAFLVEGQMEQLIIQRLCPGRAVRRIGCNGDDVSMSALAKLLDTRLRMLKNFSPVIIILDREGRQETCESLIEQLTLELDARGYKDRFVIGMPDRTIENWILSDWGSVMEGDGRYKSIEGPIKGKHGKSLIRKLMPEGIYYHETTVGVELFLKCRPTVMYLNSESFRSFISCLKLECRWLKDIDNKFSPAPWSTPGS